jgi:hypothetical protein
VLEPNALDFMRQHGAADFESRQSIDALTQSQQPHQETRNWPIGELQQVQTLMAMVTRLMSQVNSLTHSSSPCHVQVQQSVPNYRACEQQGDGRWE